jgi:hypothetical protein
MTGVEIAAIVGESVFGILGKATAGALLADAARRWLKDRAKRKAFEAALSRAYEKLSRAYPELAASLFDTPFIEGAIAPELARFFLRAERPSAQAIADAYAAQFSTGKTDIAHEANAFLSLVEGELGYESELQELLTHRQIDKLAREVSEISELLVAQSTFVRAEIPEVGDTAEDLRLASDGLLNWPQTLGKDHWIDRPEADGLLTRIADNESSITLLLGAPGSGKSALMARVANTCLSRGHVVLGLKADQLPESVDSLDSLRRVSDLEHPILASLRVLGRERCTVLFIDQLDALSELVDLHTNRLNVLLRLIRAADGLPNVHVVCSCRSFERKYDIHLSGLEAQEIELELPAWSAVEAVLGTFGLKGDAWPEAFREVLRTPQCLKLFLQHFTGSGERAVFESYHRMLEHLFSERLFRNPEHQSAGQLLFRIATQMAESETLVAPVARFDAERSDLDYLLAADLLRFDEARHSVTFSHQTIFDFARARAFILREGSLSTYVLARQNSLYVRPKLWSALAYLRGGDRTAYEHELSKIWNEPVLRPHLRILLMEFIGLQDDPFILEKHLLRPAFSDPARRAKAFVAIAGRQAWFDLVKGAELPALMVTEARDAWPARTVLQAAWKFARDEVLALVRAHWIADSAKHGLAWYTLRELQEWKDDAVGLALDIVRSGKVAGSAICDLALVISSSAPVAAVKFFAAYFRNRLTEGLTAPNPPPAIPESASDFERGFAMAKWHRRGPVCDLLELRGSDFHGLPAIAEAAPKAFLDELWMDVRGALEDIAEPENEIVLEYRGDSMLATTFEQKQSEDSPRGEYPLMEALLEAVLEFARTDAPGFKRFVRENEACNVMAVHRLLALGLCEIAKDDSAFGLAYLLGDGRRLNLGNFHEDERETKALIRAIVPQLSDADVRQLEQAIRQATQYRRDYRESERRVRFDRARYDRQFRLRLLRQIPPERLSSETRELMRSELESAFPDFKDERREVHMTPTRSPMSAAQMGKAADAAILRLFSEYPDARQETDFFKHRGGSRDIAMAFAEFAKENPKRAIALLRTLDPSTHQLPVAHAIDAFAKETVPNDELFALITECDAKGFRSEGFREGAASALRKRAEWPRGLPDAMIDLLERWLAECGPLPGEPSASKGKDDGEKGESVLWRYGGLRFLPRGSYPFLNAIYLGLLLRETIPQDRLFDVLRAHLAREKNEDVWSAFSYPFSRGVPWLDKKKTSAFVSDLLTQIPNVAASVEGTHLIASAVRYTEPGVFLSWLDCARDARWKQSPCAYGELLGLAIYWHPSSNEFAQRLGDIREAAMAGQEVANKQFRGLVHAAVHLWEHAKNRAVFTSILCDALRSPDKALSHSAIDLFRVWKEVTFSDETRPIFEAVRDGNWHNATHSQTFLLEALAEIFDDAPQIVFDICQKVIAGSRDDLGNLASGAVLDSENLINIALSLQRLSEPHKSNGLVLFEQLVEHEAYRAREVLADIDRRPGHSHQVQASRRRKRKRK